MPAQKIVAIGTSAGGVDALMAIARELPRDFPAPILVVLHIPAGSPSALAPILDRQGELRAKTAQDGEALQSGVIYVAPSDRHLIIERGGTIRTVRGPRENRHRPAIDPLFRSAALAAGADAIGVVLTGSLDDGTAGLQAIKRRGGVAIVQDPRDALFPDMPQSAIENVDVDDVVPLGDIPSVLMTRVRENRPEAAIAPEEISSMDMEKRIAEMEDEASSKDERPGQPSSFSCPDCGGVLWEIKEGEYGRFRCRVGHAFSPESMLAGQDDRLEEALWSAVKTLEETARLTKRLATVENERGHEWLAKRFSEREHDARERADLIRSVLVRASAATGAVQDAAEHGGAPSS